MHVSAVFDSGNIEVVAVENALDVQLRIRPDPVTETPDGPKRFAQWFHFRAVGRAGEPCRFRILDLAKTAYPDGWPGYRVVASHDRVTWFRVPTRVEGDALVFEHTPRGESTWYAYFAPYGWDRHQQFLGQCGLVDGASVDVLGHTIDGRTIDRVRVGDTGPVIWIIARQHPGESMAEWWMEGFLGRLLSPSDPLGRRLRGAAQWHVVPNMNPDGAVRGHLRTNAVGVNLNRVWHAPSPETSPEVWCVLKAMDASGVDLCLDVHGDEGLPYNFVSGAEGVAAWGPYMAGLQARFLDAYERANPDFQQVYGYPIDAPGEANLTMCTNQIAQRFGCLAMTLEQPFKDNADAPDEAVGWSPARCQALGASVLDPVAAVLDDCVRRGEAG